MKAGRVLVGHIGIRAFDAASKIGSDEEIEDPVDAVRSHSTALRLRDLFGDVVGARRPIEARECLEHRGAHISPLLALVGQPIARSGR